MVLQLDIDKTNTGFIELKQNTTVNISLHFSMLFSGSNLKLSLNLSFNYHKYIITPHAPNQNIQ